MIQLDQQTIDGLIEGKKAAVIALLDDIKGHYLEYKAAKFARHEEAVIWIEQSLEQSLHQTADKLKRLNTEIALLEAFKAEFEEHLEYYARQLDDLLNSIEPLIPPSLHPDDTSLYKIYRGTEERKS